MLINHLLGQPRGTIYQATSEYGQIPTLIIIKFIFQLDTLYNNHALLQQ